MANVNYARIGKETTFGTHVTPTRDIRVISEGLHLEQGHEFERTIDGVRIPTELVKTGKLVRGPIELFPKYDTIGEFLMAALGKVATTQPDPTNAPNVYSHAFTHLDDPTANWPSYSIDVGVWGVKEKQFVGCAVNSLTLDLPGAARAGLSTDILGRDESAATITTATLSFSTLAAMLASEIVTWNLKSVAVVPEAFSMTLNNNFPAVHAHKSRLLPKLEFGELDVSGELSVRFESSSQLDDFLAENVSDIDLKLQGATIQGSYKYELAIDINAIYYNAAEPNVSRQDRVVQRIPWRAIKPSSGDFIKLTLQNNVTSY